MSDQMLINGKPISTDGHLYVFEIIKPDDVTQNGSLKCFRDTSDNAATCKAMIWAHRHGVKVRRKAVI